MAQRAPPPGVGAARRPVSRRFFASGRTGAGPHRQKVAYLSLRSQDAVNGRRSIHSAEPGAERTKRSVGCAPAGTKTSRGTTCATRVLKRQPALLLERASLPDREVPRSVPAGARTRGKDGIAQGPSCLRPVADTRGLRRQRPWADRRGFRPHLRRDVPSLLWPFIILLLRRSRTRAPRSPRPWHPSALGPGWRARPVGTCCVPRVPRVPCAGHTPLPEADRCCTRPCRTSWPSATSGHVSHW